MEKLLTYVWKHKLMKMHDLLTTDGRTLEIIDVGRSNSDAGPDFFNAKVRIGSTLFAGNVEVHINASDWYRHQHHTNPNYNNVILHVVKEADIAVETENGVKPPQFILAYPTHFETTYHSLLSGDRISCSRKLTQIDSFTVTMWKGVLLAERLERKSNFIVKCVEQTKGNWEETFYITLARYFGFGVNNDVFERLARSLPLIYLQKHRDSIFQVEAFMFGQAGLLDGEVFDQYAEGLQKEYAFLRHKFQLNPLPGYLWKMLRLRPDNFPHVRIAEFAALIQRSEHLFSQLLTLSSLSDFRKVLRTSASEYWDTHYSFTHSSPREVKYLGRGSIDGLIINVMVPLLFTYGRLLNSEAHEELALHLLEELPAEYNFITKMWKEIGLKIENAYDSQAFIQLKKEYCDTKKCLCCRFGHKLLTIQP